MRNTLHAGLYERLIDQELQDILINNPDLKATLRKIDDETAPHLYAQFIGHIVHQALRIEKPIKRIVLVNRLIELLSQTDGLDFFLRAGYYDANITL